MTRALLELAAIVGVWQLRGLRDEWRMRRFLARVQESLS